MRGRDLAMAALLAALAGAAAAQSLGELARQEQEKKAKGGAPKKPAPSFTDADLAARPGAPSDAASPSPSPAPSSSPAAKAAPAASPSPAEDESAVRRRQEAEWRIRFANARERVSLAEAGSWRTVIETVFVSGIPVQQPVKKFEETAELRAARQALEDLEEEFRRTGLPAGWAR